MSKNTYAKFCNAVSKQIKVSTPSADKCLDHLKYSLTWTNRALESKNYTECELLLNGSYGAAVEAVSLVSFGLIRPAILSLRSHYELSLMFLYYKDHLIEWRNTKSYVARPKLPGEVKKYLRENYLNYDGRWNELCKVKKRKMEDCYGVLSGIAHGTALESISKATKPEELIEDTEIIVQSIEVFLAVGESVSDIYSSCFEENWLSLPDKIRHNLESRFGGKNARKILDL